ncbi:MAG: hypothetical protein KY437_07435 [Actinobacteria bacterium]|nr:hypothetical protein [Actinomycetota bacterium]
MTDRSTDDRRLRYLAAALASVLLLATAVGISRVRQEPERTPTATVTSPAPTPTTPEDPSPPPSASEPTSPDVALPVDPAAAESMEPADLMRAGQETARGPWADLGHEDWQVEERPVYIARGSLGEDRRQVRADVTIAFRADRDLDQLVLRLLPAAESLADSPDVTVRRGGETVSSEVDRGGARLLVPLDPPLQAGEAASVRIQLNYALTDRSQVVDDGGPAGFGLLAWNPDASVLGHWLPLLTFDEGEMIPWGDVGAFPPAVWSVIVETGAELVTGGSEDPCPAEVSTGSGCVWARGIALRDVSMVAYDALSERSTSIGPFQINAVSTPALEARLQAALDVSAGSFRSFLQRFGSLAWRELDVVAAPLGAGAAGMEFPGLLLIDDEPNIYDSMTGGFGAFVVTHEVAHQWFHALVGNGSLTDPVVDESLAQYLSYLAFADLYGEAAAQQLADSSFAGRYLRARDNGVEDRAPAQPLSGFGGMDAYGAMVYARAPLAWIVAEERIGRDAVVAFLRSVVDRWALDALSDDELLAYAREQRPEIAEVLDRFWFDPAPVDAR